MRFAYFKLLIICCLSFLSTISFAQDPINPSVVEQKSLQLYDAKNWAELIPFVNQALAEGNDYFYLRMRLGIAYYEQQNYTKAAPQFNKALSFNNSDIVAQEYLYYSYLLNGRYTQARLLSKEFSKELAQKTGTYKPSTISYFYAEGGTKIADSTSYYNKNTNSISNYYKNATYLQAGLGHFIGSTSSLFHAITYFSQDAQQLNVAQFQYYLKASFPLRNGFQISPALHWVNLSNSYTVTLAPPLVPLGMPSPPSRTQTVKTVKNYFVSSIDVQKVTNNFTFGLGTTFSNIGDTTQMIHSGFISVAPLGNTHLVFGTSVYMHTLNSYSTINYSYVPFIYVEPFKKLSLKLSYLTNQKDNIIEDNGYLINNSIDFTKSRISILANGTISKHLSIYGLYQSEQKQEQTQKLNYKYAVFVAGFKVIL